MVFQLFFYPKGISQVKESKKKKRVRDLFTMKTGNQLNKIINENFKQKITTTTKNFIDEVEHSRKKKAYKTL